MLERRIARLSPAAPALAIMILAAVPAFAQREGGPPGGGAPGGPGPGPGAMGGAPPAGGPPANAGAAAALVGKVGLSEVVLTTQIGGRLSPRASVAHAVPVNGTVTRVFVLPGQEVRAGQALFSLERDDLSGSYAPVTVSARAAGLVSAVAVRELASARAGEAGVTLVDVGELLLTAYLSDKDASAVLPGAPLQARVAGLAAAMTVPAGASGGAAGATGPRAGTGGRPGAAAGGAAGASGPAGGASARPARAAAPVPGLIPGRVLSRSPEPDYKTGLFTLVCAFPGAPAAAIGRFATVELPVGSVRGIFVSQDLLQRAYGRYELWVVDAEGLLRTRQVKVGAVYGDRALIAEGLAPGESILLKRTGREKAGDKAEGGGS